MTASVLAQMMDVVLVIEVSRRGAPGFDSPPVHPAPPRPTTRPATAGPEQVLAERFARGEIDADEYRERLGVLRR